MAAPIVGFRELNGSEKPLPPKAHHWEAVHSVRIGRCLACLAPAQPLGPPPVSRRLLPLAGGAAVASAVEGRADPDVGRRRRPRAPPFS